jgi:3-isopropylmalate dehydrogenase
MNFKIVTLPGDGIGPEVTDEAVKVLERIAQAFGHEVSLASHAVGGIAFQQFGEPLPSETLRACLGADAVLLGAVGGPAFDQVPRHLRPETGLLKLRQELGVFANLRPAVLFPALTDSSPLHTEIVSGTDILVIRELLGGLYFGRPRSLEGAAGQRNAVDTMRYSEPEIERIAHVAMQVARTRRRKVVSVDKANVLDCSRLWREVVTRIAKEYPDIELTHAYVDSFAMALVARPASFDVVLTENMFGDILSDLAGGIVGSLGLLASASIGGKVGLYEPIHGSAPDIAGLGVANPLGAILSVAMMLRHSFQLTAEADEIEAAVQQVLAANFRTKDLARSGTIVLKTNEMGSKVAEAISTDRVA